MSQRPDLVDSPGLPEQVDGTLGRLVPWIRTGVLAVSVAAAVPTATTLYHSWMHGIPFSQVSHRLAQYDLWMKNLECKVTYRALHNTDGSRVDAGACPKSGDVAIKITSATGQATYEWIAFDRLQKPSGTAAAMLGFLISPAQAQTSQSSAPAVGSMQVAQAGMEIMCQAKRGDRIVRIIKDAGKCFRETVSPLKGTIEKREEVACTTTC